MRPGLYLYSCKEIPTFKLRGPCTLITTRRPLSLKVQRQKQEEQKQKRWLISPQLSRRVRALV